MDLLYPDIHVKLTGTDSNAFMLMGAVRSAMRRAKVPEHKVKEFTEEASAGDYDHLLRTCMKWVDVS